MFKDEELDNLPEGVRAKLGLMILGILLAAGALAGAGLYLFAPWDEAAKHKQTPPATPTPSPSSTLSSSEKAFVDIMKERPAFSTESDSKLVATGEAVCTAFDTGASWEMIYATVVDSGVTSYDAGWLMQSSVQSLCPNNQSKLPEVN